MKHWGPSCSLNGMTQILEALFQKIIEESEDQRKSFFHILKNSLQPESSIPVAC